MTNPTIALGLGFCCILAATSLRSQEQGIKPWDHAELVSQTQGFHSHVQLARIRQIAALLQAEEQAATSVRNAIHGNHAEYQVRIEKLLDDLNDQRWGVREQAEQTLIEVGGKAKDYIISWAKEAKSAEAKIRAIRAHEAINKRGTSKETAELELIHGLVKTAFYMKGNKRLNKALISTLQTPNGSIIEDAIRALGRHGGETEAAELLSFVDNKGKAYRSLAANALATMSGSKGPSGVLNLLQQGALSDDQAIVVMQGLRQRTDAATYLAQLATNKRALLSTAANMQLPKTSAAAPTVRLKLGDTTVLEGTFGGMLADGVQINSPHAITEKGSEDLQMARLVVPTAYCDNLTIVGAGDANLQGKARCFLSQGSTLACTLLGITKDKVLIKSGTFGELELARGNLKGIALNPNVDRLIGASRTSDKLFLKDKSVSIGTVLKADGKSITKTSSAGEPSTVPLNKVNGILLQRPQAARLDDGLYNRISLNNGDRLLGHIVDTNSGSIGMIVPEVGHTIIPMAKILKIEFGIGGGASWGYTVVADYSESKVIEFNDQGKEIFSIDNMMGVWDVECLETGNFLITEFSVDKVSEVTRDGKVVWTFQDLKNPYDADRLANGNTLIADTFGLRVIEVDQAGKIVWSYDKNIRPYDVERLTNGNTLIVDNKNDRVIEVDNAGNIAWQITDIAYVNDADRLSNGNTLLTIRHTNSVKEVDRVGNKVMEITDLNAPSDADRLPNGNTLVAENGGVREFDRHGNEIWRQEITWAVEVNRY